MILSKITLQGFKSFAKKAELRFDGKITAIVGPNGCGKTNIVDAIRWGLGEQKTSTLRTDHMENVIFGGAQSSRPLGMSEVSVSFDNSRHILPIDYTEVVVTRRLYRSGDSEYLLNKTPVRLKDINDLLMDTGIGAEAYSVIELKMVEDILSEKAEDRRKLLEEAAGVTKYKHRLKAAIRKLDATKSDLLRVSDIIQEVNRTVSSLQRQVQRAKRYQVLEEEVKQLEMRRGYVLLEKIRKEAEPLRKKLKVFQQKKEGKITEITKEEAGLEEIQLKLVEREKALTGAREALNETVEKIHRREGDIRVGKERIQSLNDRVVRYTKENEDLKKRLKDQESHLEITRGKREAFQVKITSVNRIFTNKKKELEVFQQGLNFKRLELNGKKKEVIECLEEINRLNQEETTLRTRIDNSQGRLERLDEEDADYRETQKRVGNTHKSLDAAYQSLQAERDKQQQVKRKVLLDIKQTQTDTETLKEKIYRDQSERDLLSGRLTFLKNVIESHEGVADGARKLLKEKAGGIMGLLTDLLDIDKKYRNAIEVGLGDAAGYLVVDKTANAFEALKVLKRRGGGNVALICLDRLKDLSPASRKHPKVPSGIHVVGWADELIACKSNVQPVMRYLLKDLLIVRDLESAQKAVAAAPGETIRAATLNGELVTKWGIFQTTESGEGEGGMIGRRQRIEEYTGRIEKLEKDLAKSKEQRVVAEEKHQKLLDEKDSLEKSLMQVEEKILEEEKKRSKTEFEAEKAEEGLQKNVEERQKLLDEIEKGKQGLDNVHPKMETLLESREQIEAVSSQIQNEVDRLETEEVEKEQEVHRLNLSVVRLNGEAKNLDYDIERSEGLIKEIGNTVTQRLQEIEDARKTIKQQTEETEKNESSLVQFFTKKEKQEKELEAKDDKYQSLKEEYQNRQMEVRQVRKDQDETSQIVHNLELQISDRDHEKKALKDRIQEAYQLNIEKISEQEPIELDEAEEQIEDARRKMKGLGVVNMLALQEHEQEKERLDFLNQQRDDLLSAEKTLKETIQKINETARTRFIDVFSDVRKNFKETFQRFFDGGEADLRLPEAEDPLEAQVEIIARPAGKHFRDLSLLSGGERALTAISLLFALYLVKPSPFCILDEIDAPLDDANVERFTKVLSEYAEKTQFIIVTHNKMTMRVAQALYGVTMEEEGVSKLVSVKFDEKKEVPQEAA